MVPRAGLEPAQLAPLPPQDSVSTNSTTWAGLQQKLNIQIQDPVFLGFGLVLIAAEGDSFMGAGAAIFDVVARSADTGAGVAFLAVGCAVCPAMIPRPGRTFCKP